MPSVSLLKKKSKAMKILKEYNPLMLSKKQINNLKAIYDKSGRSRTNKSSSSEKSEPNKS